MFQKVFQRVSAARLLAGVAVATTLALGLAAARPPRHRTSRARSATMSRRAVPPPTQGATSRSPTIVSRPIPRTPRRRCNMPGRCAPPGSGPRRWRCSSRPRLPNPATRRCLAGYGRALADNGNFQQAFEVLGRAHSPDDPDWRILSAQGAALDQLERHEEARQYYASALKITPDEPSVLSNLGLSYVLSKDLPMAEETLRRAHGRDAKDAAHPRQPGAGGRPAGTRFRGRGHCQGRSAAGRGGGECHGAEAHCWPARPTRGRMARNCRSRPLPDRI